MSDSELLYRDASGMGLYAYQLDNTRKDDRYRLYVADAPEGDGIEWTVCMPPAVVDALRLVFKAAADTASG